MGKAKPFQENMDYLIFREEHLDDEIVDQTDNLLVPERLLKKEISKMVTLDYAILEKIFKVPDPVLRQKVLKYRS